LVTSSPPTPTVSQTSEPEEDASASFAGWAFDESDRNQVMAAFRQAIRPHKDWVDREHLLRDVAWYFGHQRLGPRIKERFKGHLRTAIRRRIIEADGDWVRALTPTMNDYRLDELRQTLISVMRKGTNYEREEVIQAVAHYLGFRRVTESVRTPIKSAINSAIRQGVLGYEGSCVWRED
jgi:hypothetical protein